MDGWRPRSCIRSRRKSAHTPSSSSRRSPTRCTRRAATRWARSTTSFAGGAQHPAQQGEGLVQLHRLNAELKKRSDERVALVKDQAARSMAEESPAAARASLAEAAQVMASSLDWTRLLKGSRG
jgi:hypothetical protein